MPQVDHVMEHKPAIGMHAVDKLGHRAKRGNDDGHPMPDTQVKLGLHNIIAAMDNQVHRKGRRGGPVRRRKAFAYYGQPFIETVECPLVLGRKTADDAGPAAGKNQFGAGGKKHRRRDKRQPQTAFKKRRHAAVVRCHGDRF